MKETAEQIANMSREEAHAALHDATNSHEVYANADYAAVTSLLRGRLRRNKEE
jgi:hypothetical protein